MKLAYLSHAVIPSQKAHSIHVMKMCGAFAENGAEVDLITAGDNKRKEPARNAFGFYSVPANFQIREVRWFRSLPGKYGLFGLMSALKSIRLKPDLVYGRYLIGVWFAWLMGKTVVFEAHSDLFNRDRFQYRMASMLVSSERCRMIVVISESLKKTWVDEFPTAESKIMVAHDGADAPVKTPQFSFRKKEIRVAYAGSMMPGKGMELIAQLIPLCPDVQFVIAGGDEAQVQHWKSKIGTADNVEFLGFIPHYRVHEVLTSADILLAPYQERVEAGDEISRWMSPLKIFEYMSAYRPVISSGLPVLREVLKDSENALLVRGDRAEEWKEAMTNLAKNRDLAEKLAKNAYDDFVNDYTWNKRAKKILEQIS